MSKAGFVVSREFAERVYVCKRGQEGMIVDTGKTVPFYVAADDGGELIWTRTLSMLDSEQMNAFNQRVLGLKPHAVQMAVEEGEEIILEGEPVSFSEFRPSASVS